MSLFQENEAEMYVWNTDNDDDLLLIRHQNKK